MVNRIVLVCVYNVACALVRSVYSNGSCGFFVFGPRVQCGYIRPETVNTCVQYELDYMQQRHNVCGDLIHLHFIPTDSI